MGEARDLRRPACGKHYSDYQYDWVSQDPKIQLSPYGDVILNIEGVDQTRHINALSDSGKSTLYFCYGEVGSADDSDVIWIVDVEVKSNLLYMYVNKDNVSDYEGKTIVLEQDK